MEYRGDGFLSEKEDAIVADSCAVYLVIAAADAFDVVLVEIAPLAGDHLLQFASDPLVNIRRQRC